MTKEGNKLYIDYYKNLLKQIEDILIDSNKSIRYQLLKLQKIAIDKLEINIRENSEYTLIYIDNVLIFNYLLFFIEDKEFKNMSDIQLKSAVVREMQSIFNRMKENVIKNYE